jgi:hypothetical protein
MDFLIERFHGAVTYPNLNILFWLNSLTHNFALAIMLFSGVKHILFTWSATLLDEIALRRQDKAHSGVISLIGLTMMILSALDIYTFGGVCFALAILESRPMEALNDVLYPAVPRLTALPGYDLTLWGQTISLTQHKVPWLFLLPIAAIILLEAYPKARLGARAAGPGSPWGRPGIVFMTDCIRCALYILALSWLFAAGAVLAWMTDYFLGIPDRFQMVGRVGRVRPGG